MDDADIPDWMWGSQRQRRGQVAEAGGDGGGAGSDDEAPVIDEEEARRADAASSSGGSSDDGDATADEDGVEIEAGATGGEVQAAAGVADGHRRDAARQAWAGLLGGPPAPAAPAPAVPPPPKRPRLATPSRGGRGGGAGGAHRRGGGRASGPSRVPRPGPVPFWKRIPGTSLIVDGFEWASPAVSREYILTHFHADHYTGLGKWWPAPPAVASPFNLHSVTQAGAQQGGGGLVGTGSHAPAPVRRFLPPPPGSMVIYCTPATAALAQLKLRVRATAFRVLPYGVPALVDGGTARLTFLDANHCPGAAQVLLEVTRPQFVGAAPGPPGYYLHTGDFRWAPWMARLPALRPFVLPPASALALRAPVAASSSSSSAAPAAVRRLDALFLDTTYADAAYSFPPQEAVVAAVVRVAERLAADPGILFVFGAYTIGKERLFMAVAKALGPHERVCVDKTRLRTLSCLGWSLQDMARLTTDPHAARIHVVPMGALSLPRLQERLRALRGEPPRAETAAASGGGGGGGGGESRRGRGRGGGAAEGSGTGRLRSRGGRAGGARAGAPAAAPAAPAAAAAPTAAAAAPAPPSAPAAPAPASASKRAKPAPAPAAVSVLQQLKAAGAARVAAPASGPSAVLSLLSDGEDESERPNGQVVIDVEASVLLQSQGDSSVVIEGDASVEEVVEWEQEEAEAVESDNASDAGSDEGDDAGGGDDDEDDVSQTQAAAAPLLLPPPQPAPPAAKPLPPPQAPQAAAALAPPAPAPASTSAPARKPAARPGLVPAAVPSAVLKRRGNAFADLLAESNAYTGGAGSTGSGEAAAAWAALLGSGSSAGTAAAGSSPVGGFKFHSVVGFRPTGWAFNNDNKKGKQGQQHRHQQQQDDEGGDGVTETVDVPVPPGGFAALDEADGYRDTENSWDRLGPRSAAGAAAAEADELANIRERRVGGVETHHVAVADGGPGTELTEEDIKALMEMDSSEEESGSGGGAGRPPSLLPPAGAAALPPPARAGAAAPAAAARRSIAVSMTKHTRGGGARMRLPDASGGPIRLAPGSAGGVTLYSVPYSEHSSFAELRDAVATLDPVNVIPTVNARSRAEALAMVVALRREQPEGDGEGE